MISARFKRFLDRWANPAYTPEWATDAWYTAIIASGVNPLEG